MRYQFIAILIIAIILFAGCAGDDPEEEPVPEIKRYELGLEVEEKTAAWANAQALPKAVEWKNDAQLVYLEWLNCNPTGIMGEGDVITLYYSSTLTDKYYKIVVDENGVTDYEIGEVKSDRIFEKEYDSVVFNWNSDSDVLIKQAPNYFTEDDEEVTRLIIQPASTLDLDGVTGNKAIAVIFTNHQDIYFSANHTALYLERRRVLWV